MRAAPLRMRFPLSSAETEAAVRFLRRHVPAWIGFWLCCFWLWLLLAGEWNRIEWIAAASAATLAATVAEFGRSLAGVGVRVPLRWVGRAWSAVPMVVIDFGIVLWALVLSGVRREVVRGRFRSHPFPPGEPGRDTPGIRAWAELTATLSPNAYVVGIDPERQRVLLHDLVPRRASERPA